MKFMKGARQAMPPQQLPQMGIPQPYFGSGTPDGNDIWTEEQWAEYNALQPEPDIFASMTPEEKLMLLEMGQMNGQPYVELPVYHPPVEPIQDLSQWHDEGHALAEKMWGYSVVPNASQVNYKGSH